eukprot:8824474-Pyramimonas_sp.AAC.1
MDKTDARTDIVEKQIKQILAGSPAASVPTSVGPGGSSGGGVGSAPRAQQDRTSQFTPTYLELKGWVTDWSNQEHFRGRKGMHMTKTKLKD